MESWKTSHSIIQHHFDRTHILDQCRHIHYCVNGDIELAQNYLKNINSDRASIVHLRNDANHYEFPTLNFLRQRSLEADIDILYLHTKGASRSDRHRDGHNNHLDNMCYNCISYYKECRQHLTNGYDGVGLAFFIEPFKHFSGNIWWARSEHIRKLPELKYGTKNFDFCPDFPDRHDAEKWLCSITGKFYNMSYTYRESKYYGLTY